MKTESTPEETGAYVLGHIRVKDKEKWAEYCRKVPATVAPWGGSVVMRGTLTAVLTGEHKYTDTVLIRFPDAGSITSWHHSPAYQALIKVREQAADVVILSYKG